MSANIVGQMRDGAADIYNYDGTEIAYGVLVSTIFVPSTGPVGPTLVAGGDIVHKDVKMTLAGQFVKLTVRDKALKPITILVPVTSFTHLVPAK